MTGFINPAFGNAPVFQGGGGFVNQSTPLNQQAQEALAQAQADLAASNASVALLASATYTLNQAQAAAASVLAVNTTIQASLVQAEAAIAATASLNQTAQAILIAQAIIAADLVSVQSLANAVAANTALNGTYSLAVASEAALVANAQASVLAALQTISGDLAQVSVLAGQTASANAFVATALPTITSYANGASANAIAAGSSAAQAAIYAAAINPASYLTLVNAASTYDTISNGLTYLTKTSAASTYFPLAGGAITGATSFGVRPTFNGATPYDTGNLTIANYLTTANAAATYDTVANGATYLTQTSAASTYLKLTGGTVSGSTTFSVRPTFNGATPYDSSNLTISNYLTTATAAATYDTVANSTTYLTKTSASSTYFPLAGGTITGATSFSVRPTFNGATPYDTANLTIGNYLTTANAASTYLTQSSASSTYLTTSTAASTYLKDTGGALSGLLSFSSGGAIGPGATGGLYMDSSNLALRTTSSSGTIFFQPTTGSSSWATLNSSALNLSVPISSNQNSTFRDLIAARDTQTGAIYFGSTSGSTQGQLYWSGSAYTFYNGPLNASAYNVSSDSRLKENVEPVSDADSYAIMTSLQPVTYQLVNSIVTSVGFIAQDVANAAPLCATTDNSTGYMAVNYGQMIAYVPGAIRELKAQIESLQGVIATLTDTANATSNTAIL